MLLTEAAGNETVSLLGAAANGLIVKNVLIEERI
jgi:hypothetical protein